MNLSTSVRGAQVIALPTAALEPVVNRRQVGRYPKSASVLPQSRLHSLRNQRREQRRQEAQEIQKSAVESDARVNPAVRTALRILVQAALRSSTAVRANAADLISIVMKHPESLAKDEIPVIAKKLADPYE